MGKRNKKKHSLMHEWPDDKSCGVRYEDLIMPLKRIVFEGYKLERLPLKQFRYTGYNIGPTDQLWAPTPEERFSSRWLDNEAKNKRTLLDNVIMTVFQLGIEQGRRLDYGNRYEHKVLRDIVESRTATINKLRAELSQYDPSYIERPEIPLEHDDEDLLIDQDSFDDVDVQASKEE